MQGVGMIVYIPQIGLLQWLLQQCTIVDGVEKLSRLLETREFRVLLHRHPTPTSQQHSSRGHRGHRMLAMLQHSSFPDLRPML